MLVPCMADACLGIDCLIGRARASDLGRSDILMRRLWTNRTCVDSILMNSSLVPHRQLEAPDIARTLAAHTPDEAAHRNSAFDNSSRLLGARASLGHLHLFSID